MIRIIWFHQREAKSDCVAVKSSSGVTQTLRSMWISADVRCVLFCTREGIFVKVFVLPHRSNIDSIQPKLKKKSWTQNELSEKSVNFISSPTREGVMSGNDHRGTYGCPICQGRASFAHALWFTALF